MTFQGAEKYLNSLINYEIKDDYSYKESFKLERIKSFLDKIGNPQNNLKCIHIAGSKGKGSTCAFVAYILREAGFKTGLYTSPHLSDFRERIRILGQKTERHLPAGRQGRQKTESDFEGMISEQEITDLVKSLKPVIDKFNKNSQLEPLSFFEVYTAIALQYFKNENVDFAVLETGLGGRLDATNVVNPLVCGITPISFEHRYLLGNTLREIATEKAGIIKKKGQIVISSPQEKEAQDVIQNRCNEYQAKLYLVGKDITYKCLQSNQEYQTFDIKGLFNKYGNLKIKLLGNHQLINASTALGIVDTLRNFNINIPIDKIKTGLENTRWPGRFEIIKNRPMIILDAAHNAASARVLKQACKRLLNSYKPILVFGISNDKDIKGVVKELEILSDNIILTKADNPRAVESKKLKEYFSKDKSIMITDNTRQAINLALEKAKAKEAILVTGSLFVVAEVRERCLN